MARSRPWRSYRKSFAKLKTYISTTTTAVVPKALSIELGGIGVYNTGTGKPGFERFGNQPLAGAYDQNNRTGHTDDRSEIRDRLALGESRRRRIICIEERATVTRPTRRINGGRPQTCV